MKSSTFKTIYLVKRKRKSATLKMFDENLFGFRAKWSANLYKKWCKYRNPNEEFYVDEFLYRK